MSGYGYNNSIVSRSETEALKEMIFKRAREREEALNADTQEQYTTSVQRDVMDIARDSFVSTTKNNPFAQIVEKAEAKEALFKVMKIETNHIDFTHYFICANDGFDKGFSLFIKTDKIIVVLYEAKKIIFYEN